MKFNTLKKANKLTLFVIIFFAVLSAAGILFSSLSIILENTDRSLHEMLPLLAGSIFFLLITFLIFLQSYAWYTGYYVKNGNIILQGVYSRGVIPLDEVEDIKIITEKEAEKIIEKPLEDANRYGKEGNIPAWFKSNREYTNITKYCTIQIVQSYTGGATIHLQQYTGSIIGSNLIYLKLKHGKIFLLSPENAKSFIREVEAHTL